MEVRPPLPPLSRQAEAWSLAPRPPTRAKETAAEAGSIGRPAGSRRQSDLARPLLASAGRARGSRVRSAGLGRETGRVSAPLSFLSLRSRTGGEMKAKPGGEMEDAEERRVCENCKRDVAAANFSLHEAHCLRFLAVCPGCQEPVARKDLQEHLGQAHQQVRCPLCHQKMQQYLLEQHQAEECQERLAKCSFCELELPHHRLQAHLDPCSSRTTMCWDCGKYITYKSLEAHTLRCQAAHKLDGPGPNASLCQTCSSWFPDEQYLQHLNECTPLSQLLGALSTHSPLEPDSPPTLASSSTSADVAEAEKIVRPKTKEKVLSPVGRPSLKPPKSKKGAGQLAFTATVDEASYDQLATCSRCNILLPRPTLQKHEKKCRQAVAASLPALRRSPRLLGKGGTRGVSEKPS